jgi:hypothetical protein
VPIYFYDTSAIAKRYFVEAGSERVDRFEHDASAVFNITTIDDDLVDEAVTLVRAHRLRGCDSLQLAAALRVARADEFEDFLFICADGALNAAAAAEDLTVENPNHFG